VYIRYFWQGNHQTYGHIRCIYTVLANSNNAQPSRPKSKALIQESKAKRLWSPHITTVETSHTFIDLRGQGIQQGRACSNRLRERVLLNLGSSDDGRACCISECCFKRMLLKLSSSDDGRACRNSECCLSQAINATVLFTLFRAAVFAALLFHQSTPLMHTHLYHHHQSTIVSPSYHHHRSTPLMHAHLYHRRLWKRK
jgi:hypothetical protein